MFELGVDMMAANLRRRHPDASPEEIERLLHAWLLELPGAEEGDGPGVPCLAREISLNAVQRALRDFLAPGF